MTPLLATVLGVVLAVVVIVLVARSRRSNDTVDSFRRGLDALSPEARKPVVDQVQHHAEGDRPSDGRECGPDAGTGSDQPNERPASDGADGSDDPDESGGAHGA